MNEHSGPPPDWAALAAAVSHRRETMGLRQSDLESRGGPSTETLRLIEGARRAQYTRRTLRRLETALAVPTGWADHVLAGTTEGVRSTAPGPPPPGMTAAQLGEYVDAFVRSAVGRVTGVGADQYAETDGQRFERMTLAELLDWTLEEVQDVAVYAAMLGVRLQWLKAQLTERGA